MIYNFGLTVESSEMKMPYMKPAAAAMRSTKIGFTPRAQMAMAHTIGIQTLSNDIFACFAIVKQGEAMRATTAGRMPRKVASTQGMFRNCVRHVAISRMTNRDGSTVPSVDISAPAKPPTFLPTKMEMFTANIPGQVCATATKSMNCSLSSQRCFSTTSASMRGIIA